MQEPMCITSVLTQCRAGLVFPALQVKPAYKMLDEFRSGSVEGYVSVLGIIAESKQLQVGSEGRGRGRDRVLLCGASDTLPHIAPLAQSHRQTAAAAILQQPFPGPCVVF